MLQYATYYTLICGLSQYDLRPFTFQTTLSCPITHRLVNSVTASEASVRHTPTATTPVQEAACQPVPARNVPREPPAKYVVINMVFTLFDAPGHTSNMLA